MKNLLALISLSVALFTASVSAADYKKVTWETLNEHVVKKEIENPFEGMEIEDIRKMQQIAIVNDIIASGQEVDEETQKLVDQANADLKAKGYDVEKLFKIREDIIAQREQEFASTNPALDDANIQMRGFLLPLEFEGKKVKEFLLVPYVGACIHEPPPAANQIVYAKLVTPIEPPSLSMFTPIEVKGKMSSEQASPELNLVDGAKEIPTSYTLTVDNIEFITMEQ
ncbi:DUF3299 domain-containing protein [Thalassotalea sp. HSM 43]|uniref:DUF3299 domain-containing protein n=1 Tax=Thalassotalea sp. HSM 43 TaxID=2552945 RepID=UPI001080D150|nr:DUF3299 domain-containing protein [Thalassotalea sp. HSM 43]QBY03311.1 DUF3299 domain-containing protein [Thalassotalea sp. HSM 43]